MFYLISGGVILALSISAFFPLGIPSAEAQPGTSPFGSADPTKELDDKIVQFFDEILKGNSTAALNNLLPSGTLASGSGAPSITEMKNGMDKLKTEFGEFRDYEKIDMRPIGKSQDLVIVRYLAKYEKHPVVWTFTFYRRPIDRNSLSSTPNPWNVVGVRLDSNLDLLLLPMI